MYKKFICILVVVVIACLVIISTKSVEQNTAVLEVPEASNKCIALLTNEIEDAVFEKTINEIASNPNVTYVGTSEYQKKKHYLIAVKCKSPDIVACVKQKLESSLNIKTFYPAVALNNKRVVGCVTGDAFIKPLDNVDNVDDVYGVHTLLSTCREKLKNMGFGNDKEAPIIGGVLFQDLIVRVTELDKNFFAEQNKVYSKLKDLPVRIIPLYCYTYKVWKNI